MAPKARSSQQQLALPTLVFGIVEVRRLRRELESLEDFIKQGEIREPGKQQQLPRTSRLLDALATDNNMQLLQPEHRTIITDFLHAVETEAPNIHVSFAIDPSSAFTAKIVTWLRTNIHPFTLLEVGVQPTIAVGCVVRTTNKVFDFSLRERFTNSQQLLISALDTATASASSASVPAGTTESAA